VLAGEATLAACAPSAPSYPEALDQTWQGFDARAGDGLALRRELLRYATLAPSSHNTQCWRFAHDARGITISPDFARRCPAVDPDDHHIFVSLGCATENLVLAAAAHGLRGGVAFDPAGDGAVRVELLPAKSARASVSYDAIPLRQSSRDAYDGRPLARPELQALADAGTGPGIDVTLLTGKTQTDRVLDFVVQGNTAQMDDPAFMRELLAWMRFSDAEAVAKRDGLFTRCSGNPVLPRAIGRILFDHFYTVPSANDLYAKDIRSSAGIAVFSSAVSDRSHWVEAGRAYERFALLATALGIRTAMINQPVEVASLRPQFAGMLGLGNRRPDLVVRFGRGPLMPRSLRRPVSAVLV